jgi:hypothetical protein
MVCIPSGIAFTLGSVTVVLLHGPLGSAAPYPRTAGPSPACAFEERILTRGSERNERSDSFRPVPKGRASEETTQQPS